MECQGISHQPLRQLVRVSLFQASMNIKVVVLTGILELFRVLVFINITVVSDECMFLQELLWRLHANSICLSWKCFDTNIWVKCFSVMYKFKYVSFLYLLFHLHILKLLLMKIHLKSACENTKQQNIHLFISLMFLDIKNNK